MTKLTCYTCHCILEIPDRPYDESKAIFKQQCATHRSPQETLRHVRQFSTRTREEMITEQSKSQYQRR